MNAISEYETQLVERLIRGLEGIPGLRTFGITQSHRMAERAPTVSFQVDGRKSIDIAKHLGENGVFAVGDTAISPDTPDKNRADIAQRLSRLGRGIRADDLRVLDRREIDAPAFRAWAMKHVPDAPEVKSLMARNGRIGFDPYTFPPALVAQMVDLLLGVAERPAAPGDTPDAGPRIARWLGVAAGALVAAGVIVLFGLR